MHRSITTRILAGTMLAAVSLSPISSAEAAGDWVASYDALLARYTSSSGVSYRSWKANAADLAKLKSVVDAVAAESVSGSSNEQLAFYLNAYNAWILHRILEEYPTSGPGNGNALKRAYFFKSKSITVAGKKMSFSALENDIIRPRFKEPRIHFALNCASASCPPLHGKAFRSGSLDGTLTSLTRAYVNSNPLGVRVDSGEKTVYLSEIFDWYAGDFTGGALAYVNGYRSQKIDSGFAVKFQKYDWSLNEKR